MLLRVEWWERCGMDEEGAGAYFLLTGKRRSVTSAACLALTLAIVAYSCLKQETKAVPHNGCDAANKRW